MGQKINPIGFRIGITKKYQSLWFARFSKYKYSQSILEDQMLRKTLTKTLNDLFLKKESFISQKQKNRPTLIQTRFRKKKKIPTITSITIERNFIPYQIIIGIHATHCSLLKQKLIRLPFNSEFKSKINTAFSFFRRAKRTIDKFQIKRKKKEKKKKNIKKKRFNKRKKCLAIYNKNIAKYLKITKKGNQIIQNLMLRKRENGKKIIFFTKRINKLRKIKPRKIINLLKKIARRKRINRINQLKKIDERKRINQLRKIKPRNIINQLKKISPRKKRLRLLSFRREFFLPYPKVNKVVKIILGKKLYLSKNKKQLNINLFEEVNHSFRNYLINSHKKNFKNSSKNIINLRKKSSKIILENPSKLSKNYRHFDDYNYGPVLRLRRDFFQFKKKTKDHFFKKTHTIIKLKKNFSLRMKKKFIRIYFNKIHNKFTTQLKKNYYGWYDQMIKNKNLSPFSFLKKWRLARSPIFLIFLKTLKTLSERKQLSLKQEDLINVSRQLNKIKSFLVPLEKLLIILKKKIRFKFNSLKKEFLVFGTISKVQGFAFYQVLYYFNHLQKIVNEFTKITKRELIISKFDTNNNIDKYINNIVLPFVKNKKQSNNSVKKTVTFIKNKKQSNQHKIDSISLRNKTVLTNPLNSTVKNKLLFHKLTKKQPEFKSYNEIFTHLKKIRQKNSRKREARQNQINSRQKSQINSRQTHQTKLYMEKMQEKNSRKMSAARLRTEAFLLRQAHRTKRKKKARHKMKTAKMKFIIYIKDIIKKHRTKNLYFYLPIIAEARRKIRKNNTLLQIKAKKFFGPKVQSLIKENIAAKKDKDFEIVFTNEKGLEFISTDSANVKKIKNKLTPCIENILTKSYHLKIQRKETHNLLRLRSILEEQIRLRETVQFQSKVKINFFKVKGKNFLSKASTISQSIVDGLETRKSFRRIIKKAQLTLMKKHKRVKGVKIQVAGRLNGAEIARTEWIRVGRVPLQTLSSNIDYSYRTASTIYGIIGVKVWIFKGYTKLLNY
uniref:Small ribosomal subunit protein uS3c n=1 Tax=Microglena monadina TaxID=47904 RepID=A0A0S2IBZ4_9CHLO|nr:ribosomal protein S3 [Microglena monadina]